MWLRLGLLIAVVATALAQWSIVDVDRTIDVTSQIVKVNVALTLKNTDDSEQNGFEVIVSDAEEKHLSTITAQEQGNKGKLRVNKAGSSNGYQKYKVELLKRISKGGEIKVNVNYRVTRALTPLPAEVAQSESQFVVYDGSACYPAVYPVEKEKTTVKTPPGKILSATTVQPSKQEAERVVYGPYSAQPAFNSKPIKVHFESNAPFVTATVVERIIEISHWGNVAVEEYIELEHKGAQLKGTFSRIDFQMDRRGRRMPALQAFTTVLPASAKDIYYRDEIGNISTSAVRVRADSVEVEIRPRYPLFGGWRTSYVIGYNVPAYEYLFRKGNEYTLKMRVLDHIFDNVVVEQLTTKIHLPELATNIKLATPFTMDRRPDEVLKTYLDTVGRPVIIVKKSNLVPDHIQPFSLSYEFKERDMLREPFIATAFFFSLFLFVIIYVRFDFSLVSDSARDARDKIAARIDGLARDVDRKQRAYSALVSAVGQFKSSREESVLKEAKKAFETTRQEANKKLTDNIAAIRSEHKDVGNKADELLTYDKSLSEGVDAYLSTAAKSTSKVGAEDNQFNARIAEARARADSVLASL